MYISTRVWVLRTPNAGRNGHFQRFLCKKTKKVFLGKKVHFFGNKTVDQPSGANLKKNCFLLKFAANFFLFIGFLHKKCWKWPFRPAFGVRNTQMLVKICNTHLNKYFSNELDQLLKQNLIKNFSNKHASWGEIRQAWNYLTWGWLLYGLNKPTCNFQVTETG